MRAVAEEAVRGGIFIVPRCLGEFGHFQTILATTEDVLKEVVGHEKAEAVQSRGYQAIHELLSPSELMTVADAIQRRLEHVMPRAVRDLVAGVLQHDGAFHYELHPNVRFHVPYDVYRPHAAEYEKYARDHGEGKLSPHDPHRDQWYRCPENAINVWIAIGPVERGNGMSLYPDLYDRPVRREKSGSVSHDQPFGRRVNFSLEPDDALIFQGRHMHASELNRTPHTRYVVSFRMTLSRPRVRKLSNHHYLWSAYDRGRLGRALGLGEKVIRNLETVLSPTPREEAPALAPVPELAAREDGGTLSFAASAVTADTLSPLPKRLCATRVNGKVVVFRRICPHAAADLAMGSVANGVVSCPEHNLPFDLRTGKSPCTSLASLRLLPSKEEDGEVVVTLRADRTEATTEPTQA